jgi:hypothetical protein
MKRIHKQLALLLCGVLAAPLSFAQGMRDPTLAPTWGSSSGAAPSSGRGTRAPMSVISVDGKLHLMVGTRLYAEGQKIGDSVIENISETEVWFREGRTLRKVSNFLGVKRSELIDMAAAPVR